MRKPIFPILMPDGREVLIEDMVMVARDPRSPMAGRHERLVAMRADGKTFTAIAREMGITPGRASQIFEKILGRAHDRGRLFKSLPAPFVPRVPRERPWRL